LHDASRDRVLATCKHNGHGRTRRPRSLRGKGASTCHDEGNLAADKIGGEFRQSVVTVVGPAIFDCQVTTHNETVLGKTPEQGRHDVLRFAIATYVENADHRRRLLRARHQRPRRRRAAQSRDELAPPHGHPSRKC
jgi:hypothetical protein